MAGNDEPRNSQTMRRPETKYKKIKTQIAMDHDRTKSRSKPCGEGPDAMRRLPA